MNTDQNPSHGEINSAEQSTNRPRGNAPVPPTNADPRTAINPDAVRTSRDISPESDLWTGRTHWKHFAGFLIRIFLINVAVAVAMWQAVVRGVFTDSGTAWWMVTGLAAASLLYILLRIGLAILDERYRLTSQRLFIERGILSQTVDQLELVRVDDVRISKTLLNRIFGTGTVEVMTTDASDRKISLVGVAAPEDVAEAIRTHVRMSRQRSLYVENI